MLMKITILRMAIIQEQNKGNLTTYHNISNDAFMKMKCNFFI